MCDHLYNSTNLNKLKPGYFDILESITKLPTCTKKWYIRIWWCSCLWNEDNNNQEIHNFTKDFLTLHASPPHNQALLNISFHQAISDSSGSDTTVVLSICDAQTQVKREGKWGRHSDKHFSCSSVLESEAVFRGEAGEPITFAFPSLPSPRKCISLPQSQHILMSIISGLDASLFITVCSIAVMSHALLWGILSGYVLPQAPKCTDILPKIESIALHLNASNFCSQSHRVGRQRPATFQATRVGRSIAKFSLCMCRPSISSIDKDRRLISCVS